jgi:hypothetical protein
MIDRRILLGFAVSVPFGLARTGPVRAGEIRPNAAAFSVWTPSGWITEQPENRLSAHAPDESLYLSAEQQPISSGGIKGVDVEAILDRELDDFDIKLDELRALNGVPYRRVEGTGDDEGDDVTFRMRIIAHPAKPFALIALVWGENEDLGDAATSGVADQILKTMKGV